jgi:hypothetical protein
VDGLLHGHHFPDRLHGTMSMTFLLTTALVRHGVARCHPNSQIDRVPLFVSVIAWPSRRIVFSGAVPSRGLATSTPANR